MQGAMADSPDAPLMKEEQIKACQQGRMEVLEAYVGKSNTVVMACAYKATWEPPSAKVGKGILTTYAVIVRSTHDSFPVGTKVKWVNYIEDAGSVARQAVEDWKNPDGKLVYVINPGKRQREQGRGIASAKDDGVAELSYSFNFPITDQGYYNNLRSMLDIAAPSAP